MIPPWNKGALLLIVFIIIGAPGELERWSNGEFVISGLVSAISSMKDDCWRFVSIIDDESLIVLIGEATFLSFS